MNSSQKIAKIEEIITEYAGPIAKYMLRAEIRHSGHTIDNFPSQDIPKLARKVITESIMDPEWREICIRRVYREVLKR